MVYLNQILYESVLKTIHEAKDYVDIAHDLQQIDDAISHINLPGGRVNAQRLDQLLREKYPDIEAFFKAGRCSSCALSRYYFSAIYGYLGSSALKSRSLRYYLSYSS